MARTLITGTSTSAGTVTIYWYGTTTKPTIYVSAAGTTKSNPITADYDGAYAFWVDNGHYTIVNGSPTGNLEIRVVDTNVGQEVPGTSPVDVKLTPYLGNTLANQELFNEALIRGDLTVLGQTFPSVTTTGGTASTSTTTGDGIFAGGLGVAKNSFFGAAVSHITANGAQMELSSVSEEITLSTIGPTTLGTAGLIPANSFPFGFAARVTTTITTATDWTVSLQNTASGMTVVPTMTAGATGIAFSTGGGVGGSGGIDADRFLITTNGTPGAGAIRCTVFYWRLIAPTS